MSCRLPGAPDPDAFWQLLREGRDAIIQTPPERRSLYGLAEADESTQGLESGGTWTASTEFDAGFFGISPREAATMDPQQRLMLELAWQALEDAGIPRDRLAARDGRVRWRDLERLRRTAAARGRSPSRGRPSRAPSGA